MKQRRFVMAAGLAESTILFRGQLIRDMIEMGQDVVVVAPGLSRGPIAEALLELGARPKHIAMHRSGMNPLHDAVYLLQLWRLMRSERPSCFMGYTIKPVIYGTLAAWFAGVPQRVALITGLGYAFTANRSGLLVRLVRCLYRVGLAKASLVIFQNEDDLALFRRLGIVRAHHRTMVVDGSGIDISRFRERPVTAVPATFLMIARLLGDKGVREYVEAARKVKAQFPATRFQLAGWIDDNPEAINRVELDDWISSGTIEFLGRLDDVRPALEACSVYVLPSYREGTPRTVLEAMAIGRAIVTTDVPGCRQTTVDGDNGFLVPARSATALAAAMCRFLLEPDLVSMMGKKSRQIAERKYDVRKVNAAMLEAIGLMAYPDVAKAFAQDAGGTIAGGNP